MSNINFPFPLNGQNKNFGLSVQPKGTAADMNNVRPFDILKNRARGGQRPGLDKWGDGDNVGGGGNAIVAITSVSYMELQ